MGRTKYTLPANRAEADRMYHRRDTEARHALWVAQALTRLALEGEQLSSFGFSLSGVWHLGYVVESPKGYTHLFCYFPESDPHNLTILDADIVRSRWSEAAADGPQTAKYIREDAWQMLSAYNSAKAFPISTS